MSSPTTGPTLCINLMKQQTSTWINIANSSAADSACFGSHPHCFGAVEVVLCGHDSSVGRGGAEMSCSCAVGGA